MADWKRIARPFQERENAIGSRPFAPRLEHLEPRIMFSADPFAAALDVTGDSQNESDQSDWSAAPELYNSASPDELIIIDGAVEGADNLRQQLLQRNPDAQVWLLDGQRDGVDQISDILKDYDNLTALHLISHGSEGSLSLGNTILNNAQLAEYTEQLQGWASAFADAGDLLIYGCDLAAGSDGQQFALQLANLTGADVAASDDLTGAVVLGGDWDLEYRSGAIETAQVFDTQLQSALQTTLADTPGVNDAPTVSRFPGSTSIAEDSVFSFTGAYRITLGDDDAGAGQLRLTMSTAQGSNLALGSSTGITGYSGPASSLTLFGNLNDLNNAIQTLSLTPPEDFVGSETFFIFINDQGNTGSGGAELDATELTINVTAVNDPPERIAGSVNNMVISNDAGLTSLGLGGLDYDPGGGADEAGQTLTYTVIDVARAPLVGNVYLADGVTVVTPGVYTLDQLRGMQFDPQAGSTGNTDLLVWTVTDSGGESITETIRLTQVNPNIEPVITTTVGAGSFDEGDSALVIDSGLTLADPDGFAGRNPSSSFSAIVTISGNYQVSDVLGFTNTAKIEGNLSGNTLTLSVVSGQTATVAEFQAALRSVSFFNGSDHPDENTRTISFSFSDGVDNSNLATRDIVVQGFNDVPRNAGSVPNTVTVTEDVSSGVDLSQIVVADPDAGSGVLTLQISTTTGGQLTAAAGSGITLISDLGNTRLRVTGTVSDLNSYLSDSNNIRFLHPTANLNGDAADSLFITLADNGNSGQGPAFTVLLGTADVNITPVDDPGVITGDTSFVGNEGDLVSGDLDASDIDGLTDGSYFQVFIPPTTGTAAIDPVNGNWRFTPPYSDWIGSVNFTVRVYDDQGGSTDQVISVTLNNVDDDPALISGDTSYSGDEGDTVIGDLNAIDYDGLTDGSYFSVSAQPAVGSASINPATGGWSFTPPSADWFGSTSFTVTVTDDLGGTTTQVINVVLANVDDAAVITGDTVYNGNEGDVVGGDLNATDIEGLTDNTYFTVSAQPAVGSASTDPVTGAWRFTAPDNDWFGSTSFTVTVTDDLGGTTDQLVTVNLTNTDDPTLISGDLSYNGLEGDRATGQVVVSDADGIVAYFVTGAAQHGAVSFDAMTGNWSYRPLDPDWNGTDVFSFTVQDALGNTTNQSIVITLSPVDDPAVITGDIEVMGLSSPSFEGDLNAVDPEGLSDGSYFSVVQQPDAGRAEIDPETGNWRFYAPHSNWTGSAEFIVRVTDDQGGTTEQVVSVQMEALIPPPLPSAPDPIEPTAPTESGTNTDGPDPEQSGDGDSVIVGGSQVSGGIDSGGIVDAASSNQSREVLINPDTIVPALNSFQPEAASLALIPAPQASVKVSSPAQISPTDGAAAKFIDLRNLTLAPRDIETVEPFQSSFVVNQQELDRSIDQYRQQAESDLNQKEQSYVLGKDMLIGLTFSVSAVLLSGLLRTGSLFACLISMLPLWRSFDPLPILNEQRPHPDPQPQDNDTDEQVEDMFDPDRADQRSRT